MTHAEIAKVIGVSRGMVFHIEKTAMKKIKVALEKRGIKPKDLLDTK
jgi:DNA-directed RNA polymerase specialized sigma subunit